MITVRQVDITDDAVREAIHLLHAEVFSADDWVPPGVPKPRTGYWWVAFDGKEPVAFAGLAPSRRQDKVGYMRSAGVLKSHRGMGLQKRLIRKRVAFAKSLGWTEVITDTLPTNVPSMRSLVDCGFKPYSPQVKWSGCKDAVYWCRKT